MGTSREVISDWIVPVMLNAKRRYTCSPDMHTPDRPYIASGRRWDKGSSWGKEKERLLLQDLTADFSVGVELRMNVHIDETIEDVIPFLCRETGPRT